MGESITKDELSNLLATAKLYQEGGFSYLSTNTTGMNLAAGNKMSMRDGSTFYYDIQYELNNHNWTPNLSRNPNDMRERLMYKLAIYNAFAALGDNDPIDAKKYLERIQLRDRQGFHNSVPGENLNLAFKAATKIKDVDREVIKLLEKLVSTPPEKLQEMMGELGLGASSHAARHSAGYTPGVVRRGDSLVEFG